MVLVLVSRLSQQKEMGYPLGLLPVLKTGRIFSNRKLPSMSGVDSTGSSVPYEIPLPNNSKGQRWLWEANTGITVETYFLL
jgi:hypothetical protein